MLQPLRAFFKRLRFFRRDWFIIERTVGDRARDRI
jgi:hypothetical protein